MRSQGDIYVGRMLPFVMAVLEPPQEEEPLLLGDLRSCLVCGCTDLRPCPGGCRWVAPHLCSQCLAVLEPIA